MKTAIYAGSFDPVTCGHLDIIIRAARLFDRLVVAVMRNSEKTALFTPEERVALLEKSIDCPAVRVLCHDGLVASLAREMGIQFLVRGIRSDADCGEEFLMAEVNRSQNPELETVFLQARPALGFVSGRAVRELAARGGRIDGLVPDVVLREIKRKR